MSNDNTIFYPQDYKLKKLVLTNRSGKTLDLTKLVVEFSYFEDIFAFSVSGYLVLRDSAGFIELDGMTGNETLEIDFGKFNDSYLNLKRTFRMYKISNVKPIGNLTSVIYKLHFCSEELILSEQLKIQKSYDTQKISDIVSEILTEKMGIEETNLVIEDTYGVYDFNIGLLKPFEAISWLSTYARPTAFQKSADMLFFENKDGFNFRSIQSLYKSNVYKSYKYQAKNIPEASAEDVLTTVLDYEVIKFYDVLDNISSGMYANRLITINPLTQTYKVTDFNYKKDSDSSLNDTSALYTKQNRLGFDQSTAYPSLVKFSSSNTRANSNDAAIEENPGSVEKDIFLEDTLPIRTSALAALNHTKLKIVVPGDSGLAVGRIIELDIPKLNPGDSSKSNFFSGKYVVTALRHVVQVPAVFQTILEITKDSFI
jgi:hypothetical protein